jgi:hypothetical protein
LPSGRFKPDADEHRYVQAQKQEEEMIGIHSVTVDSEDSRIFKG